MCGIVGVIPKGKHGFNKIEQKMFYELLFADMLRGNDATGVITCHNNGDFGIMKEAVESYYFNAQFIDSDLDKDLFKNGSAVIGHNRAKTIGENKDENAHPFVVDETFAMVHNGTLRNHTDKTVFKETAVDSEALAILFKEAMDQEDFVQAMSEASWKVYGAYACVWYDQKRNQVGMLRNSQRPLSIMELDSSILFGSEASLLNWISSRNNLKHKSWKSLKEDTLYLFDLKKAGGHLEEFPLASKPTTVTVTPTTQTSSGATKTVVDTIVKEVGTKPDTFPNTVKTVIAKAAAGAAQADCSKNHCKRLKKHLVGKPLAFVLDDWVERFINEPGDEYFILGEVLDYAHDLTEVKHLVRGLVNIKTIGLTIKEVAFCSDWVGTVEDVEYDARLKQAIIKVKGLVPVLENNPTVH